MKERILKGLNEGLKELKSLGVDILNKLLYVAVATLYIVCWALDSFYNFVAYFYKNINKRLQKVLFYLILILAIAQMIGLYREIMSIKLVNELVEKVSTQLVDQVKAVEIAEEIKEVTEDAKVKENASNEKLNANVQVEAVETKACTYDSISCEIKEVAERYGIDYKLAIAIAKAESGADYTGENVVMDNNVGGLDYWDGAYSRRQKFNTLSEGIEAYISNLKRLYIDKGLDTIEEIQPKYCPIGASNDPNNKNVYWLGNVTAYYNELVKLEAK